MSIKTVHIIVTAAMVIIDVILCALTFVFSNKKAKALEIQKPKDAILFDSAEQLCCVLFSILFIFTLLNVNFQIAIEGLIKIIEYLEALTRG